MAESDPGGSNSPPKQSKEISMEKRLLLAFILMGAVLFTTPYFFQSNSPPAKKTETVPPKSGTGRSALREESRRRYHARRSAACSRPGCRRAKGRAYTIDTNVYQVTFSNKGGGGAKLAAEEVSHQRQTAGTGQHRLDGGIPVFADFKVTPAADLGNSLFVAHPEADGLGITYEFSNGHLAVTKKFLFGKDSYKPKVTTEVMQDGKPVPHLFTGVADSVMRPSPTPLRTFVAALRCHRRQTDQGGRQSG